MSEYVEAYADVNLLYGGLFIADERYYANVVEVIDLDSATGTTNMVLVDEGSCSFDCRDLSESRSRFKAAMNSAGPGGHEHFKITGLDRQTARLIAYAALWSCGHRDMDRETVLTTDRQYSTGGESWTPNGHVNGEHGLRRWLRREYGIECVEQPRGMNAANNDR